MKTLIYFFGGQFFNTCFVLWAFLLQCLSDEMRYSLVAKGRRTKCITVVTTLVDPKEYPAEEIAELYGARWNVELDIRHIKQTLNMKH